MNEGICLNIGCGLSCGKNWRNIDSSPPLRMAKLPVIGKKLVQILRLPQWPDGVRHGDIMGSNLLPDNSCALIFASHVLEHLSLHDARLALKNIFRLLQQGGTLRIIVPDLAVCVNNYIRRRENQENNAAHSLMEELGMGLRESRTSLSARLKSALANSRHQWMYDRYSLQALLVETGFIRVRLSDYGQWSDERFAEVEEKTRLIDAVCFEAQK
jgi:predicted SAM-dependent methyltransferase